MHTKGMEALNARLPRGVAIPAGQWVALLLLDILVLVLGVVLGSRFGGTHWGFSLSLPRLPRPSQRCKPGKQNSGDAPLQ